MSGGTVFDASVVLNLLGSGHVETILRAIPGRRIVVEVASGEVLRDPVQKTPGDHVARLQTLGLIEKVPLPATAEARFVELVSAEPPDDLGDGEAATIACAEALSLDAALDERKGRRVASARTPVVNLVSSVEIFAMAEVAQALGAKLGDAVFSACVNARMRVLPKNEQWLRDLLGPARVAQCPNVKKRRGP